MAGYDANVSLLPQIADIYLIAEAQAPPHRLRRRGRAPVVSNKARYLSLESGTSATQAINAVVIE